MAATVKTIAQGAKNNFQLGTVLVGLISGAGGFAFDAIQKNDYLKLGLAIGFMVVVFVMYRDYKIKTAELARLKPVEPVKPVVDTPKPADPVVTITSPAGEPAIASLKRLA